MGRYGLVAVIAVNYLQTKEVNTPNEAWKKAISEIFEEGIWQQVKACPKNAFLGLCEEGLIKGIESGSYCKSQKNKGYALRAVEAINNDPTLVNDKKKLWEYASNGSGISHNHQMDVVISLWNTKLLTSRTEVTYIT
ncbi:DUF6979 family protein [Brevibacillus sp. MS2.2]|uniref:DUF6979 family protein n=1 Tax=Brevibacillus sp. MS2.2 TaxID=2738981 RepID=UPI00156BD07A|nr:hypothetical protein [Brevibacillus sp. MS2.2]NRR19755.1 hypothetical protein [Brevibacillus sp. MS2.2]